MLTLFQEHLPDFEKIPPHYLHHDDWWREKKEPRSIKGVALRGEMNVIRLAVYPLAQSTSNDLDLCGQPHDHVNRRSDTGADLSMSLYFETREMFQYMDTSFGDSLIPPEFGDLSRYYAELGNVEIVQNSLDAGADRRQMES
ncbi:hypothetical protein BPAE_0143g00030 [Botrytis paeoniae]|uniref:Uncharacterized protein n=1 Tax=Botrytis paeoniae TaxID=278948 RepID=A0A4Z1FER3_9HELO|nr:hypothetical protein BPAE_0143g00030 [Botrytis paeoniae]